MRLPRLSNQEYEQVRKLAGRPLDQCPTCGSKPEGVGARDYGRVCGSYKLWGRVYKCDCDEQIQLHKSYLLAGIPDQYQRLDWANYGRSAQVKERVQSYLANWATIKLSGLGLEFYSTRLGTGKTFAATYVAKELVKKGEKAKFARFAEVISVLAKDVSDWESREKVLKESFILVLDEVQPPKFERQALLYQDKLEDLIRMRTDFNRPTITTTNLTPENLEKEYPRVYSLLSAKQIRVEMPEGDFRMDELENVKEEILLNGEVHPIT